MWLVSTLYERNLFYQQLNLKYAMLLYVRSKISRLKITKDKIGGPQLLLMGFYFIDFVLGITVAAAIILIPSIRLEIHQSLSYYTLKMLDLLESYLDWIMGVPWGIKLNTPVSHFLGSHYLYVLKFWRLFYMEFIAVYMAFIVKFFILLLPFGFTLPLTALHDFLKFLNLCLICFFVISQRITMLQVSALKSLGRLFMGKKWNILKDRVDTCHYDLNQLLVGTIIFTILLFLVPTTGMFTLVFLYLRVLQFAVQLGLRVCVVLINKMTLYCILNVYSKLSEQPLTQAKLLIKGVDPQTYTESLLHAVEQEKPGMDYDLQVFSFANDDVVILWNGLKHSIEEMKEVIEEIPTEEVAEQLEPNFQHGLDGNSIEQKVIHHSMLHWVWTLPHS